MHACQAKSAVFFLAQRVKVQKLIIPHVGQRAYKRGNGTDVSTVSVMPGMSGVRTTAGMPLWASLCAFSSTVALEMPVT